MANDFQWGPANPHPLSKMRTELICEGKYDEYDKRGKHTICVKVVDVFGCDTSITVEVDA